MTVLLEKAPTKSPSTRSALIHLSETCCDPVERTACGIPILPDANEVPWNPDDLDTCVVCISVRRDWSCPRCSR
jgi:hypothetical protein